MVQGRTSYFLYWCCRISTQVFWFEGIILMEVVLVSKASVTAW